MTTIPCDECGDLTRTDQAVYRRVHHYSRDHWVVLMRLCPGCALSSGWRRGASPNSVSPYFSNARQFENWLQLTSH